MKILSVFSIIMSFFVFMCGTEKKQIAYEGIFTVIQKIDVGDPLFYKIDKYYVYSNDKNLETNAVYNPEDMRNSFIMVVDIDSLDISSELFATISFKSTKDIKEGIVFARGKNQFNNVRFSSGERFPIRRIE